MKVLVAVDGSEYTMRMLQYLAAHGEVLGHEHQFVLFTAVAPVPPRTKTFIGRRTLEDYYREQAELVFSSLKAFTKQHGWIYRTRPATPPTRSSRSPASRDWTSS